MQDMKKDKKANMGFMGAMVFLASIVIVGAVLIGGGMWGYNKWFKDADTTASITGDVIDAAACQWSGQLVDGQVKSYAEFSGTAVNPTFKVWKTEPDGWGNPRESFVYDKDNPYTTYSSSAGVVTLSEDPAEAPFYVMATLTNYATMFFEVSNGDSGLIPCSTGDDSLSDYNSEPRAEKMYFIGESALAIENISLGFSANATDKEITKYAYLATDDDEGVAIWKVTFYDSLGMRTDSDNDNTYDEGVKVIKLKVGDGKEVTIFDPAKGINEIDSSTGKYEYVVKESDYEKADFYMDGESLPIKVYVKANVWYDSNSTVSTSADDELLGAGETIGTLSILSSEATDLGDVYITS